MRVLEHTVEERAGRQRFTVSFSVGYAEVNQAGTSFDLGREAMELWHASALANGYQPEDNAIVDITGPTRELVAGSDVSLEVTGTVVPIVIEAPGPTAMATSYEALIAQSLAQQARVDAALDVLGRAAKHPPIGTSVTRWADQLILDVRAALIG